MQTITTIGLDIAKSVFQVHGVDAAGEVVFRHQSKRRYVLAFFQKLPACLVGIEACASSHHWSRELQALGHTGSSLSQSAILPQRSGCSSRSRESVSSLKGGETILPADEVISSACEHSLKHAPASHVRRAG